MTGNAAHLHDIKPSNILVFQDDNNRLKVTKWDCTSTDPPSRTSSGSSGTRIMGDTPYLPSESKSDALTSRPHDVWSLRCVYLELLIWYLEGPTAHRAFQQAMRLELSNNQRHARGWFVVHKDQCTRSPHVQQKLTHLMDTRPRWTPVINAIISILDTDPQNRIKPIHLVAALPTTLS
jgi:serine/threonine protein kinase